MSAEDATNARNHGSMACEDIVPRLHPPAKQRGQAPERDGIEAREITALEKQLVIPVGTAIEGTP